MLPLFTSVWVQAHAETLHAVRMACEVGGTKHHNATQAQLSSIPFLPTNSLQSALFPPYVKFSVDGALLFPNVVVPHADRIATCTVCCGGPHLLGGTDTDRLHPTLQV
jgi:hypothetical protein